MRYPYSEYYLTDAMQNYGEMTEYATQAYKEDLDVFQKFFLISGYAKRWECGDPQVLCGLSGTELYARVMEACGKKQAWKPALVRYDTGMDYWVGYILALYQWEYGQSFADIAQKLSFADLARLYPTLHTLSDERAVEEIQSFVRERQQATRLQEYRKRLGISQRELAEAADVNLRTLQQYEIGDKDLRKAAAEKVLALAKVLRCEPASLLETVHN